MAPDRPRGAAVASKRHLSKCHLVSAAPGTNPLGANPASLLPGCQSWPRASSPTFPPASPLSGWPLGPDTARTRAAVGLTAAAAESLGTQPGVRAAPPCRVRSWLKARRRTATTSRGPRDPTTPCAWRTPRHPAEQVRERVQAQWGRGLCGSRFSIHPSKTQEGQPRRPLFVSSRLYVSYRSGFFGACPDPPTPSTLALGSGGLRVGFLAWSRAKERRRPGAPWSEGQGAHFRAVGSKPSSLNPFPASSPQAPPQAGRRRNPGVVCPWSRP